MDNQEKQTQTVEIEKAQKGTFVTMPEIIQMEALRIQGMSKTQIAKKVNRGYKTVTKSLQLLSKILPESPDLREKIIKRVEEIAERHLQNAEIICQAADQQVMRKIYLEETSAMDAAKIRQIYGGFLAPILGSKVGNPEVTTQNKVVNNFINNFIVKPNDNSNKGNASGAAKDVKGKHETIIEGIVS